MDYRRLCIILCVATLCFGLLSALLFFGIFPVLAKKTAPKEEPVTVTQEAEPIVSPTVMPDVENPSAVTERSNNRRHLMTDIVAALQKEFKLNHGSVYFDSSTYVMLDFNGSYYDEATMTDGAVSRVYVGFDGSTDDNEIHNDYMNNLNSYIEGFGEENIIERNEGGKDFAVLYKMPGKDETVDNYDMYGNVTKDPATESLLLITRQDDVMIEIRMQGGTYDKPFGLESLRKDAEFELNIILDTVNAFNKGE